MNVMIIAKNEFIKFLHQKKIIFLLIIFSVCTFMMADWMGTLISKIQNDTLTSTMPDNIKNFYLSLNGVGFSYYVCQNFVYRNMLPLFLIFISIIVISVVNDDYEEGTMKFMLISSVNKEELILGKIVGIFAIIAVNTLVFLILSIVYGAVKFGMDTITISDCIRLFYYYVISLIPEMAWSIFLMFLCLLLKNKLIVTFIGVIGVTLLANIDRITMTKNFSPIGVIQECSSLQFEQITAGNTLLYLVVPIFYIILFSFVSILKFKREDIL